jgi:hypothetical protein
MKQNWNEMTNGINQTSLAPQGVKSKKNVNNSKQGNKEVKVIKQIDVDIIIGP